jgi:large subunit ribosomal protein L30
MATIKIKQIKGQAGRPIDQKSTLESLGLGKINKFVKREVPPSFRGMIRKEAHFVEVIA